jgi:hypothetical protein
MNNIEWFSWPDPRAVTKGAVDSSIKNLTMYSDAYQKRKQQYPNYTPSQEAIDIATQIEKHGHYKIENFLNIDQIDAINKRVDEILENANHPYNQNKISENEARHTKPFIQCLQPLVSAPEIHPFVFNDLIIDIAGAYMDCYPAFGTCNLRRSYVNDLPETGTQTYHVDPNSPRFLKFFIYLNDVDEDGGPFCYIEGTHQRKFWLNGQSFNQTYNWPTDIINQIHEGQHEVKYLTAKKGDLLMADTNGWHRGTKPFSQNRTMLTLDYVCHVEEWRDSRFDFKQLDFDKLDDKYKPLCDFLKLV